MSRPLTLIALVLAIFGLVFHFAHVGGDFLPVLNWAAIILLAVGVLTGK